MDRRYVFPMLKNAEVLQCMNELGIPFSEEDLQKPSAVRMFGVYEAFADILMGATRSEFDQNAEDIADEVPYHEIHTDTISLMAFHHELTRLMVQVGIDDFSIRDLNKPEAQRVKRILSAVINFAKFREERMPVYDEHIQKSDSYVSRYQNLIATQTDMNNELEQMQNERVDREPKVKAFKEQRDVLTQDLRALKKAQTTLMDQIDELKREKQDLTQRLSNSQFVAVNLKQEIAKIRGRIVHSPEKLREVIEGMGKSLGEDKGEVMALERQARELQARIDAITTIEHDLRNCTTHMEECEAELARVEEATRRNNRNKDMVEQKQIEVREVEVRDTQLNRQIANAVDKLDRAQRQHEGRRNASQKRMTQIHEEYAAIAQDRANRSHEIETKKAYISQTEKKISELRASVEAEARSVQAEYTHLRNHIDLYIEEMSNSMKASSEVAV